MAYRGKYPNRVRSVYSVDLLGKRCMKIELNDGRRFLITPKEGSNRMLPKLGQELASVQVENITIEVK